MKTMSAKCTMDQLAAVREVWDPWVEKLPYLNDPGCEVMVDKHLVPF